MNIEDFPEPTAEEQGGPKVVGYITFVYCPICSHHKVSHGKTGCDLCLCPKKNLELETEKER